MPPPQLPPPPWPALTPFGRSLAGINAPKYRCIQGNKIQSFVLHQRFYNCQAQFRMKRNQKNHGNTTLQPKPAQVPLLLLAPSPLTSDLHKYPENQIESPDKYPASRRIETWRKARVDPAVCLSTHQHKNLWPKVVQQILPTYLQKTRKDPNCILRGLRPVTSTRYFSEPPRHYVPTVPTKTHFPYRKVRILRTIGHTNFTSTQLFDIITINCFKIKPDR